MKIGIICSACGRKIGRYIIVRNQIWLEIGGARLYAAHGECAHCGQEYHYRSSDKLKLVTMKMIESEGSS